MAHAHAHPSPYDELDALTMLANDHRTVEQLFDRLETAEAGLRRELVRDLAREIEQHALIEEHVLYPAVRTTLDGGDEIATESTEAHAEIAEMLEHLKRSAPKEAGFADAWRRLRTAIGAHVEQEEREVFPRLRDAIDRDGLVDLGRRLSGRKGGDPTKPTGQAG